MTPALKLLSATHRPVYPALPEAQQVYVLLEALPDAAALNTDQPGRPAQALNFCLVLDRSGSMAGEKLNALKAAARRLVDRLGPADWLSVVFFDDTRPAELVAPAGPVLDRASVQRKIGLVEERGGTHLSTGLQLGLEELRRGLSPERVNGLLLLTDGQTWEDQDICRSLAEQCRADGIPIYALGLGVGEENNWDPRFLEELGRISGGDWALVESSGDVDTAFEKLLGSLQRTVVTHARLTMRLVQGVEPRSVWRVRPLISRLDSRSVSAHDVQVLLGDIHQGPGQALLAELLVPARPPGAYRILQVDVVYDLPGSGLLEQRAAVDVVLNFAEGAASPVDGRMMNLIERVVAHRLQTQALDDAAAGQPQRATQRLRAAATRLLELGETDLARQAEGQIQQIERTGQADPAAAQKLRYATQRLAESAASAAESAASAGESELR